MGLKKTQAGKLLYAAKDDGAGGTVRHLIDGVPDHFGPNPYFWGPNSYDRFGGGGMNMVVQVAVGWYHTLILCADGTVWAAGRNNSGQLGLGDFIDRSTYTQIPTLGNVSAVLAAESQSACLIGTDLYTWGYNYHYSLGPHASGHATLGQIPSPTFLFGGVTSAALHGEGGAAVIGGRIKVWGWYRRPWGTGYGGREPDWVPGAVGVSQVGASFTSVLALESGSAVLYTRGFESGMKFVGKYRIELDRGAGQLVQISGHRGNFPNGAPISGGFGLAANGQVFDLRTIYYSYGSFPSWYPNWSTAPGAAVSLQGLGWIDHEGRFSGEVGDVGLVGELSETYGRNILQAEDESVPSDVFAYGLGVVRENCSPIYWRWTARPNCAADDWIIERYGSPSASTAGWPDPDTGWEAVPDEDDLYRAVTSASQAPTGPDGSLLPPAPICYVTWQAEWICESGWQVSQTGFADTGTVSGWTVTADPAVYECVTTSTTAPAPPADLTCYYHWTASAWNCSTGWTLTLTGTTYSGTVTAGWVDQGDGTHDMVTTTPGEPAPPDPAGTCYYYWWTYNSLCWGGPDEWDGPYLDFVDSFGTLSDWSCDGFGWCQCVTDSDTPPDLPTHTPAC